MDETQLKEFIESMREFEGWIEGQDGRCLRFSGIIESVKPGLKVRLASGGINVRLDGFFASFDRGYLDNDLFDDRLYLRIPAGFLSRMAPAEEDELECDVIFSHDGGRIVLTSPRRIDLSRNGNKPILSISRAMVGRATGKIIRGSIRHCRNCPYCALASVEDRSRAKTSRYKRFFCLRGIPDSENCPVRLEECLVSVERDRAQSRRF
jgi:hypothetical protein